MKKILAFALFISFYSLNGWAQNTSLDKFNYDKFIVKTIVNNKTIYDVQSEALDLLFDQEPQLITYTDFNNKTHQLYPWYGQHVVYLTSKKNLNKKAMYLLLAFNDKVWKQFKEIAGAQNPLPDKKYLLNGRSTFAVLDRPECDQGCGQIGMNGIELNEKTWTYHHLHQSLSNQQSIEIDIIPFYDMGRNFSIFQKTLTIDDKKHLFNSHSLMTETFKLLAYPFAIQKAALPIEKKGSVKYLGNEVVQNLHNYLTNKEYNSSNTLMQMKDQFGNSSHHLMHSFLFFIAQNYGGYDCVVRMWSSATKLNQPQSKQDVLDNYFLLASYGAQMNLSQLFEHNFKYELSDKVKQEAEVLFGK